MKNKMKPVTILLPENILEIIQQEAKTTGIPRGINLRNILVNHYKHKETNHANIRQN